MLIDNARQGTITPEIRQVAAAEHVSEQYLLDEICAGRIIIPVNRNHTGER